MGLLQEDGRDKFPSPSLSGLMGKSLLQPQETTVGSQQPALTGAVKIRDEKAAGRPVTRGEARVILGPISAQGLPLSSTGTQV